MQEWVLKKLKVVQDNLALDLHDSNLSTLVSSKQLLIPVEGLVESELFLGTFVQRGIAGVKERGSREDWQGPGIHVPAVRGLWAST